MSSRPFFSEFFFTSYVLWFRLKISILKVEKLIVLNIMMMNCTVALSTAAGCDFLPSHYLSHFLSTFFIIIFIVFDLPDTPNPQKIFLFCLFNLFIIYSMFIYCLFILFFIFFYWFSRWNDWKSIWNEVRFFLFREWQPYHAQQGIL